MLPLAAVTDECPECTATSLDFQNNFGGRDPVNWVAVQCDVGTTPFVYSFQVGGLLRQLCMLLERSLVHSMILRLEMCCCG